MTFEGALLRWGISALLVALIHAVKAHCRKDLVDASISLWLIVIGSAFAYPAAVRAGWTGVFWAVGFSGAGRMIGVVDRRMKNAPSELPRACVNAIRGASGVGRSPAPKGRVHRKRSALRALSGRFR